jgi:hypothetical protein
MTIGEWLRGGLRYRKLSANVSHELADGKVSKFFIAVQGRAGFLFAINPFTIFRHEFVIALTDEDVVVIELRRPAIFSAEIQAVRFRVPRPEVHLAGKEVIVGNRSFTPLPFHLKDAKTLVDMARGKHS